MDSDLPWTALQQGDFRPEAIVDARTEDKT